ncbi:hypothetical protein FQA39_LY11602 [Lamprigera yunnana]|nr:hypothetical protein FQA39_LY11602 [Lamprigera yunnana]
MTSDDIMMKRGEAAKCSGNNKTSEQSVSKTRRVGVDNRNIRNVPKFERRRNVRDESTDMAVNIVKGIVDDVLDDVIPVTNRKRSLNRNNVIKEQKTQNRKTRVFIEPDFVGEDHHAYLERKASLYSLEEHDEDRDDVLETRKKATEKQKISNDERSKTIMRPKNSKVLLTNVFRKKSKKEEGLTEFNKKQYNHVSNDNDKTTRLTRTPSLRKKLSNFISKDAPGFLRRSFSFKDLSKNREKEKSRDKLAAMKNSEWASSLQSLVETDIGISYKDLSFINYDVQNELLSKKKTSFPSALRTKGLSRTQSFIEHEEMKVCKYITSLVTVVNISHVNDSRKAQNSLEDAVNREYTIL